MVVIPAEEFLCSVSQLSRGEEGNLGCLTGCYRPCWATVVGAPGRTLRCLTCTVGPSFAPEATGQRLSEKMVEGKAGSKEKPRFVRTREREPGLLVVTSSCAGDGQGYCTGVASGAPLSASMKTRTLVGAVALAFLASWTIFDGLWNASPALMVIGGLPSTSSSRAPSNT